MIRVTLTQDAARTLELTVVDDGRGVPEDFLPQRSSGSPGGQRPARGARGSGLGLALVRGIAERAGGSASLRNGAHGGAVATVSVPAV